MISLRYFDVKYAPRLRPCRADISHTLNRCNSRAWPRTSLDLQDNWRHNRARISGWDTASDNQEWKRPKAQLLDACGNKSDSLLFAVRIDTKKPFYSHWQSNTKEQLVDQVSYTSQVDRVIQYGAVLWPNGKSSSPALEAWDDWKTNLPMSSLLTIAFEPPHSVGPASKKPPINFVDHRSISLLPSPLSPSKRSTSDLKYWYDHGRYCFGQYNDNLLQDLGIATSFTLQDIAGNYSDNENYVVMFAPIAHVCWYGHEHFYAREDAIKSLLSDQSGGVPTSVYDVSFSSKVADDFKELTASHSFPLSPGYIFVSCDVIKGEVDTDDDGNDYWKKPFEGIKNLKMEPLTLASDLQSKKDALGDDGTFRLGIVRPKGVAVDGGTKRQIGPAILNIEPSWKKDGDGKMAVAIQDAALLASHGVFSSSHLDRTTLRISGDERSNNVDLSETNFDTSTGIITGNLSVRRTDWENMRTGAWTIDYQVSGNGGGETLLYHNSGFRWLNSITVSPDVVATGNRVTIQIRANFVDNDWTWTDFQATGDYVHFLVNGSDATLKASDAANATPEQKKSKITILGQRFIPWPKHPTISQTLELDLEIGSDVDAGLADVDIKLGAVHAYTDELSQQYAGANGAHRMKESLKIFKPDIVPTVPKFAECLAKRSGKADEPVIIITNGGDKSVNNCSLVGYDEKDKNSWSFTAKYDHPVFDGDTGTYAVVWDVTGGQITSGSAGSDHGGGSNSITVKYSAGQFKPSLRVYRTDDKKQTTLVGTAAIHTINVYSTYVDGTEWTVTPVTDDNKYGSETKLERKKDDGDNVNVQVRVDGKAQGSSRVRVSPDGYPQNEYWVTASDSDDLPQPYAFKPESTTKAWVQGYGDPSQSVDNLSVRVKSSKSYEDDSTAAKFTTVLVEAGVDASRNQQITFDGTDRTSMVNPYRFWLNNNRDARITGQSPGGYTEEDETDTGTINSAEDHITCQRDLEDFTRYWVAISNRSVIGSRLRQGDVQVQFRVRSRSQTPQVKLFLAADPDGGLAYLTDYAVVGKTQAPDPDNAGANVKYHNAATPNVGSNFVTLTVPGGGSLADALVSDSHTPDGTRALAPFLFEGVTAGVGDLEVRITVTLDGVQVPLGHGRATVDLRDIKQFYEQWTLGDTPLTFASQTPKHVASTLTYDDKDKYFSDQNYLLFVHGWNMKGTDKDVFANTGYKRLWWNGYKGRYGALRWPTGNGFGSVISIITDGQNYDDSEKTALLAGERLAAWLPSLSSQNKCPIDILGHSMGNMVVGNALSNLPVGQESVVGTYIASQAAVPAQLYRPNGVLADGDEVDSAGCRPWISTILGFGGWNTANVYNTGLFENIPNRFEVVNFYNQNDYALSEGVSGLNQRFKPDAGQGGYLTGPSNYEASEQEFRDRFFFNSHEHTDQFDRRSPEYIDVYFWSGNILSDAAKNNYFSRNYVPRFGYYPTESQYHIMAYLSESRRYPVGASGNILLSNSNQKPDLNLGDSEIWHRLKLDDESKGVYSSHRWHSAQFRMTMPEQKDYWKKVLKTCGYPEEQTLP